MEGRPQRTRPAVSPQGDAVEDWKVIQMLSEELHTTLPYETIQSVRHRMYQIAPNLVRIGFFEPNSFYDVGQQYNANHNRFETNNCRNHIRNDVVLKSNRRANIAADYWITGNAFQKILLEWGVSSRWASSLLLQEFGSNDHREHAAR